MLRGKETAGYVIVSAGKASILSREHQPVWRQRQPRSKTTWVGCVEFMQVQRGVLQKVFKFGRICKWVPIIPKCVMIKEKYKRL